jgi:CRP-like cAMP-binding protein
MNETELTSLLRENAEFSRVTDPALAALIRTGAMHALDAGEELIRQGESGQRIWVLIEGELEAFVDGVTVNRVTRAGEVVGQISAVSFTPATATVRMTGAGKCLAVSHGDLHGVMEKHPDLAEALLRSMAKYLGRR